MITTTPVPCCTHPARRAPPRKVQEPAAACVHGSCLEAVRSHQPLRGREHGLAGGPAGGEPGPQAEPDFVHHREEHHPVAGLAKDGKPQPQLARRQSASPSPETSLASAGKMPQRSLAVAAEETPARRVTVRSMYDSELQDCANRTANKQYPLWPTAASRLLTFGATTCSRASWTGCAR